jgi:hypothetical protein
VQEGDSEDDDNTCEARQQRNPWLGFWCVDPMDLDAMRDACPNLQRLTLNSVMPSEYKCLQASITAIRKLRSLPLTHLCVGGPWLVNQTAVALAELTNLRSLKICNTQTLRAAGLEKLTALKRLRHLGFEGVGFQRGVSFELHHDVSSSC